MNDWSKEDLNHLYTCNKHGGELYTMFPPAYCPVCHKPTYKRHPKYYAQLNEPFVPPEGYIPYTDFYKSPEEGSEEE